MIEETNRQIWQTQFPELPAEVALPLIRCGVVTRDDAAVLTDDEFLGCRCLGPVRLAVLRRVFPADGQPAARVTTRAYAWQPRGHALRRIMDAEGREPRLA
jgi:hypothetical protein